uniref:Small ribosomal subunit protein uS5c n=1 Tax=Alaria marginata TaxID=98221 RepID=A0A8F0K096_ALAMR|nr:ribosomal protein S5 [Alaria marginata]YP_010206968.1 ribosomal protein S5 [Alaria crassifolia]YP_010207109.1 ribosomal protein S5 [Alaria praelonga]QWK44150.1 ribosomal protein S5 [Alaria marginata]UAX20860.1 ribosomal protein S5 [Alaria marginata]UAX21001.1 ribosomal protein S5 [Alaria marginata]UAX21142.1 ribosomal protein S5 [Alaria marginata]UAX21424.1 ribosomal protein S5 [Alaria marginata]
MTTPNKKIRWEQRVVKISRVSKVVKGGKKISFRATVVVGDMEERVGVGVGKAEEVSTAIKKAETDAKKNVLTIPIAQGKTIPHAMVGVAGGSKVFIRPAVPGTGVIAGGSVRIVLELAGIKNILSKQLGSNNPLNNARATIVALKSLNTIEQVMQKRQISLEQVLGK